MNLNNTRNGYSGHNKDSFSIYNYIDSIVLKSIAWNNMNRAELATFLCAAQFSLWFMILAGGAL